MVHVLTKNAFYLQIDHKMPFILKTNCQCKIHPNWLHISHILTTNQQYTNWLQNKIVPRKKKTFLVETHSINFSMSPLAFSKGGWLVSGAADLAGTTSSDAKTSSSSLKTLSSSGEGASSSLCRTVNALFRKLVTIWCIRSLRTCSLSGPKMEEISLRTSSDLSEETDGMEVTGEAALKSMNLAWLGDASISSFVVVWGSESSIFWRYFEIC